MPPPDETKDVLELPSIMEKHPKHVYAIGMISIEIGNLDILLGALLGSLLRVSSALGQIVYLTPRTAFGRLKIIENVAAHVLVPGSTGANDVADLLARAKKLVGQRHDMIHQAWGIAKDNPESVRRVEMPPRGAPEPVAIGELETMIGNIRILKFDVDQMTKSVIAAWPKSSREKSEKLPSELPTPRAPPEQKDQP